MHPIEKVQMEIRLLNLKGAPHQGVKTCVLTCAKHFTCLRLNTGLHHGHIFIILVRLSKEFFYTYIRTQLYQMVLRVTTTFLQLFIVKLNKKCLYSWYIE